MEKTKKIKINKKNKTKQNKTKTQLLQDKTQQNVD